MTAKITEISILEKEKWNFIVRSFSDYEVFYLNEYAEAFMNENEQNGIPVLLYYTNGEDRAVYVVFKRDIAKDEKLKGKIEKGKYYDLISPYGYGGFWGQVQDYELLNDMYNQYCRDNHYICEFVRFDLFSEYSQHYDGEVECRTHNVVRNLEGSMENIWMNFKGKVRRNVRRAEKNGLQFIVDEQGKYLEDFLNIYYSTMDFNNAEGMYYFSKSFFEKLNEMKDNVVYFHAMYNGKIISTEIVLIGTQNCYFYLGGTNRDYSDVRPNDFLKYQIIKWFNNKGKLKNYVLGGGYGSDGNLFQYKVGFAPEGIAEFYIGRKIFNLDLYSQLVTLREKDNPICRTSSYFPQYRA